MDEKLTENQLDVLCVLWNQAYDFLDLCEETDHFVWPTTDLRCVPDSILHDIKVNPEDDKSRPPWEVGTEDLFLQTLDVYLRACRRATPYVGTRGTAGRRHCVRRIRSRRPPGSGSASAVSPGSSPQ